MKAQQECIPVMYMMNSDSVAAVNASVMALMSLAAVLLLQAFGGQIPMERV